ncbi:MAG: hypothetical protein AUJ57_01065 [Zetaproteobacteria bacterium CG1_02_53_45]|nr:MAG: hypothetical protein AUJ57_01065 [Zetaproteobacteria bacterium CG1_02_53_45]
MRLIWLPMRWMIPLLVLGGAVVSSTAFYLYETHQSIRAFEQSAERDAFKDLFRAANFSEYMLMRHDQAAVAAELSGLATEDGLDALVLVAPDRKVVYASRVAWLGESVMRVDQGLSELMDSSLERMQGHAHFSEDRINLYVHFPIRFSNSPNDIRPQHYGALIARFDLADAKQQIIHDVESRVQLIIGSFILVALFVWLLAHFALTKRVQKIVESTEAFANGDLRARSWLNGKDELSRVSKAFDDMAGQIQAAMSEKAKLAGAIETMVECVFITDVKGVIEYVNPAFTKITGYSAAEAVGQNPRLLQSGEHSPEFYHAFWARITSGKVWSGKMIDRRKNGELYHARSSIVPVKSEHGKITHYVSVQEDITLQLEKDLQLAHAMKMESLGTLVGGIAHEFNNMLAGMVGNLYVARKRAEHIPEVTVPLNRIETLSYRAADMIKQLLAFARQDPVSLSVLNLASSIREAMELSRVSVPESVTVEQSIPDTPLNILADKTQIQQVLMNLLANARNAVSETAKPCIWITVHCFQADAAFRKRHPDAVEKYAILSVADNGHGIDEKNISRIFEPFYTTRNVGEGTGLGLSMVFGVVERHGGVIEVESDVGKGTLFKLYFPLVDEAPELEPSTDEYVHGNRELILIADDEEAVRDASREVLEHSGYRVSVAADGAEAVAHFAANPESFSLVVLDVVMPGLSGTDAAVKMREIRPDIPIVFQTGYDKAHLNKGVAAIGESIVLNKPLSPEKMLNVIASMLARGRDTAR